jgi:hypothetical protein
MRKSVYGTRSPDGVTRLWLRTGESEAQVLPDIGQLAGWDGCWRWGEVSVGAYATSLAICRAFGDNAGQQEYWGWACMARWVALAPSSRFGITEQEFAEWRAQAALAELARRRESRAGQGG